MKRLISKPLSDKTTKHLAAKQTDVDRRANFAAKAKRADTLWDNKVRSKAGKAGFTEIKSKLIEMCVGVEGCNYCEGNEARDIEHIYPKSLFPDRAFQWSNYLLACKTCNSGEKLDKFAIFDPVGTSTVYEVPRAAQPANNDAVVIDPRSENPEDYLWLDIVGDTFLFDAMPNDDPRYAIKAEYTIKLLRLNERDNLVEARRVAANHFQSELKRYVSVKQAPDFDALETCAHDPELIDETVPFEVEKVRILESIKKNILTNAHPTVWLELKRQQAQLRRTKRLFDLAQEALAW